ncbi:MAG: hypothetical protein LBF08_07300 [Dysgonamonadaceae bacterium]|jgi:hypothetical protein|nr:hypothetical protein [Dysgonamonadaceae bacterium]
MRKIKKLFLLITITLSCVNSFSQVPLFGTINTKDKPFYAYKEFSFGNSFNGVFDVQYTLFNKDTEGFNPSLAILLDGKYNADYFDLGLGLRSNFFKSEHFNLGAEVIIFDFSYFATDIYVNGKITNGFGYVYNYKGLIDSGLESDHWLYVNYSDLSGFIPYAGFLFNDGVDLSIGTTYDFGKLKINNLQGYLWYGRKALTIGASYIF